MTELEWRLYTVSEAAERMRVTRWAVEKWISKKLLASTKAGSRRLVSEKSIQEFLLNCASKAR